VSQSAPQRSPRRFYLTTAIDYSNGAPHIGHAFEKIGADVIARTHRLRGDEVRLLIGMDEHGQKVAQTAAERGITPTQLVHEIAATFQTMWARLGISYDQFMRTTGASHHAGVQALIERIFEHSPNDFYERSYQGWYCIGCESFKSDSEIVDGKCVLHPTRTLEWVEERNWFFRLSAYRDFLREHIATHPEFVQPSTRRNEITSLLEQGLEDISASRSRFSWGVPFPRLLSTGEQQTMYVWFDALPNYLTATGFPAPGFEQWWPAQLHIIGKDITRFHCVIWPAMLRAAGLALPERVWGHGFVIIGGERLSKSAGVRLDLVDAVDRFGPDAFRYFLMREIPWDADGNFSWERFEERYTADLANALGNLASRTIAMIEKYCDGVVPSVPAASTDEPARELRSGNSEDRLRYARAMSIDELLLHEGLAAIWRMVARGNAFVDRRAPWKLAKDPASRPLLEETLAELAHLLGEVAVLVSPFMPVKAAELWGQLGAPGAVDAPGVDLQDPLGARRKASWRVQKGTALFPRPETAPAGSTA